MEKQITLSCAGFWRFCLFQAHCFAFTAWLGHNVIIKSIFQQQQAVIFSKQAPIKPNPAKPQGGQVRLEAWCRRRH